jgi:transcriptional regulator with XRE-family HTH domain
MPKSAFGNYLREKRLENKYTLRGFCDRYGFDTAYVSRLENNKIKPPSKNKLSAIASALSIQENSKEWTMFFDLAHLAKNEYPPDITKNAKQAVSLLPAFLRTEDGKRVSKKKVEELIKFLETNSK